MRPLIRQVPKLQRLAIFESVARLGSFTAAGAELGVSQPAVSKQIAQLEDVLHLPLFDRSGGRPRLTDEGEQLLAAVDDVFNRLEVALAEMRSGLDVLTVALQPAVAENWFAPRMAEIQAVLAPATLKIVMYERASELDVLAHDVSIRFGNGEVPHLKTLKLADEIAVPAAAPSYASAAGLHPDSDPTELLRCELLALDETGRTWANWSGYFDALNIAWNLPSEQIVYRTHASVVAQALAGRGVILTWRKIREDLFDQELLVECGPTLRIPEMGHHLVWPAALGRDPGFRGLRDWLLEAVE